jgi:hypothetical protein
MFIRSNDMAPVEEVQLDDVGGTVCRCQLKWNGLTGHAGITAFIELERGKPAGLKNDVISIGV